MARIYGTQPEFLTVSCDRCKRREESEYPDMLPVGWIELSVEFLISPAKATDERYRRDLCLGCGTVIRQLLTMMKGIPDAATE